MLKNFTPFSKGFFILDIFGNFLFRKRHTDEMRTRKKGRQAPDGPPTSLLLFWLFLAFLYCQNGMMIPGCLAQATNTPGDVDESGDNATLGSTTPSTSK